MIQKYLIITKDSDEQGIYIIKLVKTLLATCELGCIREHSTSWKIKLF